MPKFATIVAFALVIGVIGCATLPLESRLGKPVSMTEMTDSPREPPQERPLISCGEDTSSP